MNGECGRKQRAPRGRLSCLDRTENNQGNTPTPVGKTRPRPITQDALARLAEIDPGSVSKIESGKRLHPRADIIGRLAGALKATPNYFYEKQELPEN